MKNLFLREQDKNGNDNIVFAKEGNFSLTDNKRTLELRDGYRYSGTPGKADYQPRFFPTPQPDYQHHAETHRPCFTPPYHSDRPTDWQQQSPTPSGIDVAYFLDRQRFVAVPACRAAFLFQSAQRPYLQYP